MSQSLSLLNNEQLVASAYAQLYDKRGGAIEIEIKEDKQRFGLTKRQKKRAPAQQVVVLLNSLAHNVLVWARQWLDAEVAKLANFGTLRLVRDVLSVSGKIEFDSKASKLKRIVLNRAAPIILKLLTAFRSLLLHEHVVIILGEIWVCYAIKRYRNLTATVQYYPDLYFSNACIFLREKLYSFRKFPLISTFLKHEKCQIKKMNGLTERQLIENLEKGFSFPPLKIIRIESNPDVSAPLQSTQRDRPDLAIDFVWQDKERTFLAEVKRYSTPKMLEESLSQVKKYVKTVTEVQGATKYLPLLIVPYLSPRALERLIEENVSGIDLSGNGVVIVPGEWFVYRTGAPNRYPSNAPIKNVFRGTSSLVARVFLMRPEFTSVNEIYEEIRKRGGEITMPTVSKAQKALQEELITGRDDKIRLLDAGRLLDMLELNYRHPICRRRLRVKFAAGRIEGLTALAINSDANNIQVVGDDPTRYTLMPGGEQMITIYTPSIETGLRGVEFTETNRFPDAELIETDNQTVYFDRRRADGFYWTSPLETYLALRAGGKREVETAEQMREDIKGFRYYM